MRDSLGIEGDLPAEATGIEVPDDFNVEHYRSQIDHLFRSYECHYIINANENELHARYHADIDALTTDLLCNKSTKEAGNGGAASKAGKNKKAKKANKTITLDNEAVFKILDENRLEKWTSSLVNFIQLVEQKVFLYSKYIHVYFLMR